MPEAAVLKMAEELIPRLRVADWLDRAEAAQRQLDHLDLRDLRSVVVAADDPVVARDESTRELAAELKAALVTKQEEELTLWLADVEAALDVGRVVRALRLSSMPPKAGVPFPARWPTGLAEATTASLQPPTAPTAGSPCSRRRPSRRCARSVTPGRTARAAQRRAAWPPCGGWRRCSPRSRRCSTIEVAGRRAGAQAAAPDHRAGPRPKKAARPPAPAPPGRRRRPAAAAPTRRRLPRRSAVGRAGADDRGAESSRQPSRVASTRRHRRAAPRPTPASEAESTAEAEPVAEAVEPTPEAGRAARADAGAGRPTAEPAGRARADSRPSTVTRLSRRPTPSRHPSPSRRPTAVRCSRSTDAESTAGEAATARPSSTTRPRRAGARIDGAESDGHGRHDTASA